MYRQELYRTRRADYRSEGGGGGADLRLFLLGVRPVGLLLLGLRLRGLLLLGLLLRPHASAQVKPRMWPVCTSALHAHVHCVYAQRPRLPCVFTVY